jgi:aminoacyl tRNA synthase complex-interacting multifunctional protein 1
MVRPWLPLLPACCCLLLPGCLAPALLQAQPAGSSRQKAAGSGQWLLASGMPASRQCLAGGRRPAEDPRRPPPPLSSPPRTSRPIMVAFGDSLKALDAIIAKFEAGGAAPPPAAANTAAAAPAPPAEKNQAPKKKKKPQPAPKKKKGNAPTAPQPLFTKLDLRVGVITKVWTHPTADKLWCEEVDVGEEAPRQICSGLRDWYSEEGMMGRRLIAVCNLKPRNLVGFKSHGMVLCAKGKNAAGEDMIEFVGPPDGAVPGERIGLEGLEMVDPISPAQVNKQKIWEAIQPKFSTGPGGVALFEGTPMTTSAGHLVAPTVFGGEIS